MKEEITTSAFRLIMCGNVANNNIILYVDILRGAADSTVDFLVLPESSDAQLPHINNNIINNFANPNF